MAQKKKKKKNNIQRIDKKAAAEKELLSSDSAVGWVLLLVLLTAVLVMVLVHTVRASGRKNDAPVESTETEVMPEDAKAFEEFEGEDTETAESKLFADITVEGYGTITVQLDADAAPLTVSNFVNLANSGFYDGLTFHRIINGFMMQGGDPTGSGSGGSDTNIKGEFSDNGWDNPLSHTRGAISMARANDYDSASSQFFICQEDCGADLDGKYACFGYVTEGMEYVDQICAEAHPIDDNGSIPDYDQPVITSIVIRNA